MFTSDTENKKQRPFKTALIWLLVSLFCALFGAVYEAFSHGVFAYPMLYAFAFPLVLGTLPYLLIGVRHRRLPPKAAQHLWNAGVVSLTVGSIVTGALEIYGTETPLTAVYWLSGAALLVVGLLIELFAALKARQRITT